MMPPSGILYLGDSSPVGYTNLSRPLPSTKNRGYIMGEGTYTSYNGNTYTIPGITYFSNDVIRGGVQIQKWDKELDKSEAIGGANHGNNTAGTHLEGITFDIKNVSAAAFYDSPQLSSLCAF